MWKRSRRLATPWRLILIAVVMTSLTAIPVASSGSAVLSFVEAQFDDTILDGASSIALSPDGRHAYVAAGDDAAVTAFERSLATGALSLVDSKQQGVGGVDGLAGANSVTLSPDGRNVYVTGYTSDAVAVFGRDGATGELTFVQVVKDADPGVNGLNGATSVAVSADGDHVYVAGYLDDAVAIFGRSVITGGLTYVGMEQDNSQGGSADGLNGATSVAISLDGAHVYVTGCLDDAVAVFGRTPSTGELTYLGMEQDENLGGGADGLDGAYSVTVAPDGDHVYVAGLVDNAVAVFSRDQSTGALTYVDVEKDGVGGVDGLYGATSVAVSPDGHHVFATGRDDDALVVFDRNPSTGALTYGDTFQDGAGGVDSLQGAVWVAVSPDGRHVYAAAKHDNAVTLFRRTVYTGGLSFVEMEQDGVGGVNGLSSARSVALSPDGSHVYVGGFSDDAIVVFGRNRTTGELDFVEMEQDDSKGGSADGLDGPYSVAVSPDGAHVYVAGGIDDAVAVFERDFGTGELTYVEREKDGEGSVDGLNGAYSVAISPDGAHVYVAGYSDDAVAVFGRNGATGELDFVEVHKDDSQGGAVAGLDGASSVAVSPDGLHVYVAGKFDNAVEIFVRDSTTGELSHIGSVRDGVDGVDGLLAADSVAISPDGLHAYVAGYSDDAVAVFARNESTGVLTFLEMEQDDNLGGSADGLDGATYIAVSPDGEHVFVLGYTDEAVAVFERDSTTGRLTYVERLKDGEGPVDGLSQAIAVAASPDGAHVYAVGQQDNAVSAFDRNRTAGGLTLAREHYHADGLEYAHAAAVSPDGDHVLVAGFGDDAVVVFERDAVTGRLVFLEMEQDGVGGVDGLNGARSIAFSPDGTHVYVAGQLDNAVAVFYHSGVTGLLSYVEVQKDGVGDVNGLNSARSVAVSPDGSHVYVTGAGDNAVAVFSRSVITGGLSYVEMEQDGVGGVSGLAGACSVALSPGGDYVYVAGYTDNAIEVFWRNPTTGALAYSNGVKDGVGGVVGLDGPRGLAISPDGLHVYVASYDDNAVAVFGRHGGTGALTQDETQWDGVGGVDGLQGAYSVAVAPDGEHVYVASYGDDAVAVFERHPTTGLLTFVGRKKDGEDGVDGLNGAHAVTVSPDGEHVYAAGSEDDAIVVLGWRFPTYLPLVLRNH